MELEEDTPVFIVSVEFVRGPALPVFRAPVTVVRIEDDKIAIGTREHATTVPVSNVRSITLTPMSLSSALGASKAPQG
jgi:hypothetical protein